MKKAISILENERKFLLKLLRKPEKRDAEDLTTIAIRLKSVNEAITYLQSL